MTFRLESKYLSRSVDAIALQDEAFAVWQKFVQQKLVARSSAFTLDGTVLREDLQDWFRQYGARYHLTMRFAYRDGLENPEQEWGGMECVTEIDIIDDEVALLFKLTWIGV